MPVSCHFRDCKAPLSRIVVALYQVSYLYIYLLLSSVGWRVAWRLSPRYVSKSLIWSDTGIEDPKRTNQQCTASVCVAIVRQWGISLGQAEPMTVPIGSVPSICPRIFLRVLIVYHLLLRTLFFTLFVFYNMIMCVSCFSLAISTCQVMWWGDYLYKAQVEEITFCLFSFALFIFAIRFPQPYTIHISYAYGTI